MNSAVLRSQIEQLQQCVRDMERLEDWITSLGKKVRSKSERFSGVETSDSWTGAAAREFSKELKRTREKVLQTADHASRASGTIMNEIVIVNTEITRLKSALQVALSAEAAARAAKKAKP